MAEQKLLAFIRRFWISILVLVCAALYAFVNTFGVLLDHWFPIEENIVVTSNSTTTPREPEKNQLVGGVTILEKKQTEYKTFLDESLSGTYRVTGEYYEYTMSGWAEEYGADYKCTAFRVRSGDASLLRDYHNRILAGNGANALDDSGYLIINLPFYKMSESDKNQIAKSTNDIMITLKLVGTPQKVSEGPCLIAFDTVEIVK